MHGLLAMEMATFLYIFTYAHKYIVGAADHLLPHNELKREKKSTHAHCLPQRIKSTFFEIFSSGGLLSPKGTYRVKKIFQKNVDFSL